MNKDNKDTEVDNTDKKLHISDVSCSKFSINDLEMCLDWLREYVINGGNIKDDKEWNEWKEEAILDMMDR
jgi:hypothetical protein